MENKVCRIAVFYDGTYFSKVSNYYLYQDDRKARISLKGLHEFVVSEVAKNESIDSRHCQIVDASYFRGRLTAQQAHEQDKLFSERVFEDVLMRADVRMYQQHIKVRFDGSYEEKKIDVWLALEAYEMASLKRYDVCVLITGDSDFVPLVRKLNTLGSRVMLLGWDFEYERNGQTFHTKVATDLIDQVNYPIMMKPLIEARERRTDPVINNMFMPRSADTAPKAEQKKNQHSNAEPEADEKRTGTIVTVNHDKGFAFIKPNGGGENCFLHANDLENALLEDLDVGSKIMFSVEAGSKGPVARNAFFEK